MSTTFCYRAALYKALRSGHFRKPRCSSFKFFSNSSTLSNEATKIDANKNGDEKQEKLTHFGFETVKDGEKTDKVYEVFKNVAAKYDLMNDAMSFGIHRLWKDEFVRMLHPTPGLKHLDVAGGTGDISFRIVNHLKAMRQYFPSEATSRIVVSDINQEMLNVGKSRAQSLGYDEKELEWLCANAEELPIESNTFDSYTIAFGIRNVTHIDKALKEAHRVLKPGGRFLCLEFSQLTSPFLQRLYDMYSFQVIPPMGQILARDWKSYQYLVESIRKFPSQEDFSHMIRSAGFSSVTYTNFTFGVVAVHSGFKL